MMLMIRSTIIIMVIIIAINLMMFTYIHGKSTFLACGQRGGVYSMGSHRLDIATECEPR